MLTAHKSSYLPTKKLIEISLIASKRTTLNTAKKGDKFSTLAKLNNKDCKKIRY